MSSKFSKSLSLSAFAFALGLGVPSIASATPDIQSLADYAGLDRAELDIAITRAHYQQKIIDAMTRPYEGKPWHMYRKLFITDKRIQEGVQFYLAHESELLQAEAQTGTAPEIVCAIIGVETFYGKNMGSWRVLDALYTLGFHYPPREAYFSKEFARYVQLAKREGWNLTDIKGSYAGAMGMGQFMPSSYLNFAIDFDGDGKVNLFNNSRDAVGSVANYFAGHGWKYGQNVMYQAYTKNVPESVLEQLTKREWKLTLAELQKAGVVFHGPVQANEQIRLYSFELADGSKDYQVALNNFYAITRYNKSPLYARAVYELSQEIALHIKQHKGK